MKFIRINPENDNASEFDDYKGKMPLFIKLYSPGCPHCVNMQSAWDGLEGNEKLNDLNMAIIEIHSDMFDKIKSPAMNVNGGLPTMRKVLMNGSNGPDYDGTRKTDDMINFIKENFPEASNKVTHTNKKGMVKGTKHIGTKHIGTKRIGTKHIGTKHIGTKHIGTKRIGTKRIGTKRIGTKRIGTKSKIHSGGAKGAKGAKRAKRTKRTKRRKSTNKRKSTKRR
jgi:hypothetical protein